MAARALFLVAAVMAMAAVLGVAHGASYTVGAPAGSWDLQTNYTLWVSAITFRAGDQLVFKYTRGAHDVVEVSKNGYDSCSATSPLASFATGDDTVSLPAGGVTRYFICGVPGHCAGGMKLAVTVEAADTTTSPSPSPAPVAAPVAPRAAARPPTASSSSPPSPTPVAAMAPREAARPPMPTTPAGGARAPAAGAGMPAVPPSSSGAASAGSLAGLATLAAAVAALMVLY